MIRAATAAAGIAALCNVGVHAQFEQADPTWDEYVVGLGGSVDAEKRKVKLKVSDAVSTRIRATAHIYQAHVVCSHSCFRRQDVFKPGGGV